MSSGVYRQYIIFRGGKARGEILAVYVKFNQVINAGFLIALSEKKLKKSARKCPKNLSIIVEAVFAKAVDYFCRRGQWVNRAETNQVINEGGMSCESYLIKTYTHNPFSSEYSFDF